MMTTQPQRHAIGTNQLPPATDSKPALLDPQASPSSQKHPTNTPVRYGECYAAIDNTGVHTGVYIALPSTHVPKEPAVNEISFPPILTLKIILFHILLYGFSDNCIPT
jgi:hypothetical protein